MRRRIWLALTAAFLCTLAAAREGTPGVHAVDSVGITVTDLDRAVRFYSTVLSFEKVSEDEHYGDSHERLVGVFGARSRTARLRLGNEFVELTQYLSPEGRPMPADSRSNDRWFQHIAIIVSDMDRAYQHLRRHNVRHVSPGPQVLPAWNRNAGGIQAFYFKDPDGHALEILAFPPDKGLPKWQQAGGRLFLGIDHTAIVISSTEASLRFYRDLLGMQVVGTSENHGPEQERLNSVFGARLRITALRAASGPGVELLEYLTPTGGRPYPPDARSNDLVHWQTRFLVTSADRFAADLQEARSAFVSAGVISLPDAKAAFRKSFIARDPDGHAVQIAGQ